MFIMMMKRKMSTIKGQDRINIVICFLFTMIILLFKYYRRRGT